MITAYAAIIKWLVDGGTNMELAKDTLDIAINQALTTERQRIKDELERLETAQEIIRVGLKETTRYELIDRHEALGIIDPIDTTSSVFRVDGAEITPNYSGGIIVDQAIAIVENKDGE